MTHGRVGPLPDMIKRAPADDAVERTVGPWSGLADDPQRYLAAFERIVRSLQPALDLNEILDRLAKEVIDFGLFGSLSISLVDHNRRQVVVRRRVSQYQFRDNMPFNRDRIAFPLDDNNITPTVARTGDLVVIDGWDDRFLSDALQTSRDDGYVYEGRTFYFIPLTVGDQVTAVLGTSSPVEERAAWVERIGDLEPLLGQVALVLHHACLHERALEDAARLEAHQRLVQAMHSIGKMILSTTDVEEALDALLVQVAESGVLRSLMVALVDEEAGTVTIVRQLGHKEDRDPRATDIERVHVPLSIEAAGVVGEVARKGVAETITGWDDRYDDRSAHPRLRRREEYDDKVSYFVPVKHDESVVAVLATASTLAEQEDTETRLAAMAPLIDQVAIAIRHAGLFADMERARGDALQASRLLASFQAIGRAVLQSSSLEGIVETLMEQVAQTGLFRSLSYAAVDHDRGVIHILRAIGRDNDGRIKLRAPAGAGSELPIDAQDVTADVARHGRLEIIEGWDERFQFGEPGSPLLDPAEYEDKVSYFVPIRREGRVLAILATGSTLADRQETERRLRAMEPLLDMVAVAIGHAQMVAQLSDEAQRLDARVAAQERDNLSLLRINALVQNIRRVEDLRDVIIGIYEELVGRGLSLRGMTIGRVIDAQRSSVEYYDLRPDGTYATRSVISSGSVDRMRAAQLRSWNDVPADAEGLSEGYLQRTWEYFGIDLESLLVAPYEHGIITLRSDRKGAFTADDVEFLRRAAGVVSLGISRIADLESLEGRTREQEALLEVSQAVADLTTSDSVHTILSVVRERLRERGVTLAGLGLHTLVDETTGEYESLRILEDGSVSVDRVTSARWYRIWNRQQTSYIPQLAEEPAEFPEGFAANVRELWRAPVESMLVVPHSGGVMVLPSQHVDAFRAEDILFAERIASILSVGMARLDDLRRLEQRADELAREKDFSNSLIESMLEGFAVFDAAGRQTDVNPALCRMTGFNRDELVGQLPPYPYWPPESAGDIETFIARIQSGDTVDSEITFMRKDEQRFPVIVTASVVRDSSGDVVSSIATIRDVSERNQLDSERIRTQRLRAAGELAAGVCHNLNNILTGVIGPAQLLQMDTKDPILREHVEAILTSAGRAADIVRQLYRGTTREEDTLVGVDLDAVVVDVVQVAAPRWKDEAEARGVRIEVQHEPAEAAPLIQGTEALVHDIVLNLLFNAVDAVYAGGTVRLATHVSQEGVSLEVSDDGIGMREEVRARIFEPFFTTKMEVGTGLGLATVYNTMTRWGGDIEVRSDLGVGTTFTLRFPVWDGEPEPQQAEPERQDDPPGRILIVDDDDAVAEFLVRALSRTHDVDRAQSGAQAMEFDVSTYDLALVDLGLGGMSGDQVAQRVRDIAPGIATVLISGWELNADDPRRQGFDAYLRKPFANVQELLTTVQVALRDGRRRRPRN